MTSARQALIDGAQRLQAAGVESAHNDAELLLCHALGVTRSRLLLVEELDRTQRMAYERLLGARQNRVPLQHLTGFAPFRYLDLEIGPGALVPRPETEIVVEAVIRYLREHARGRALVIDLCSGAAPIAVSLATELHNVDVIGVEKYEAAQSWGRRNAARHADDIAARGSTLQLIDGDACDVSLLAQYEGQAAVVVSNPPYIPTGMVPRDPEVAQHDPKEALYGGEDGYDIIRGLLDTAAIALQDNGYLVIEHADAQGEDAPDGGLPALIRAHGAFTDVVDHEDLAERPRYTTAVRLPR